MKNFIKTKLLEGLATPSYKLPKQVQLKQEILDKLKGINWGDIIINENGDDGVSTLYMSVHFKDSNLNIVSEGINFTIQLLHDTYYQSHMFLAPSLQGIGLAAKILKAFIMEFGHIYSGRGRTLNQDAAKMRAKLATDSDLETYSDDHGTLTLKKGLENKPELLRIIQN